MENCFGKKYKSKKILLKIFVKGLSSITKKGEIQSPSLVLDSVCRLNEVGTCQVIEQVMIMVMMVMTTR